jgi:hypothetical protein
MNIVIISDTHTDAITSLPNSIIAKIQEADKVIHAGDFISYNLYLQLKEKSKSLLAVKGNMDRHRKFSELPEYINTEIGGLGIGISHGAGTPHNIINRLLYLHPGAQIIIFGHLHNPFSKKISGIDFINPGSLSHNRTIKQKTYAVLNISDNNYHIRIKTLGD